MLYSFMINMIYVFDEEYSIWIFFVVFYFVVCMKNVVIYVVMGFVLLMIKGIFLLMVFFMCIFCVFWIVSIYVFMFVCFVFVILVLVIDVYDKFIIYFMFVFVKWYEVMLMGKRFGKVFEFFFVINIEYRVERMNVFVFFVFGYFVVGVMF